MDRYVPEIVIGFVAPSGTSFERVTSLVAERLAHYGYDSQTVRLSGVLEERAVTSGRLIAADAQDYAKRTIALQKEGDRLREYAGINHALALAAVGEITNARRTLNGGGVEDSKKPIPNRAYLIWSFKTPEEVATLRAIYGPRLFIVSVHTPRPIRVDGVAQKIAESRNRVGTPDGDDQADAERIVAYDEHEDSPAGAYGQNVRDTYPLADFFVTGDDLASINRAVDIIFAHPFVTPTKDEFGMSVAYAASLRSAELGRQVGAAITNDDGDIIATGYNEVPKAKGGQYSADSEHDHREFTKFIDSSDEQRKLLAAQIEKELRQAGALRDPAGSKAAIREALRGTHIRFLTEFGRALHAESSALMDAARRGAPVLEGTLYVTTFPCHQCTRQVIAAGIRRLVYVHPYPKSLAVRFHSDDIYVDSEGPDTKVPFLPFLGVAPRRYATAFAMGRRKTDDGSTVLADDVNRSPRLAFEDMAGKADTSGQWDANAYIVSELWALDVNDTVLERVAEREAAEAKAAVAAGPARSHRVGTAGRTSDGGASRTPNQRTKSAPGKE